MFLNPLWLERLLYRLSAYAAFDNAIFSLFIISREKNIFGFE